MPFFTQKAQKILLILIYAALQTPAMAIKEPVTSVDVGANEVARYPPLTNDRSWPEPELSPPTSTSAAAA
jgi:hypothetical protein